MDKAEILFLVPTFPVTICTIPVFSLSHSVRFFAEMKYIANKWEGPYWWLITTFRNTVICNSLNALFAIYIYWKLILYVLVLSQWQITGKCIIKRELNSNLSSFLLEIILQLSSGSSSPFQCIPRCQFPQLFSYFWISFLRAVWYCQKTQVQILPLPLAVKLWPNSQTLAVRLWPNSQRLSTSVFAAIMWEWE